MAASPSRDPVSLSRAQITPPHTIIMLGDRRSDCPGTCTESRMATSRQRSTRCRFTALKSGRSVRQHEFCLNFTRWRRRLNQRALPGKIEMQRTFRRTRQENPSTQRAEGRRYYQGRCRNRLLYDRRRGRDRRRKSNSWIERSTHKSVLQDSLTPNPALIRYRTSSPRSCAALLKSSARSGSVPRVAQLLAGSSASK